LPLAEQSLNEALGDKFAISFGGEDNYSGTDFLPAPWAPPDVITADMLEIAQRDLDRLAPARNPASKDAILRWLGPIGLATAKPNTSEDDVLAKLSAYAGFLDDMPAGVFNPRSQKAVVAKHQWFPSVKELIEILTAERDKLETKADRLDRILKTGERAGPLRPKWTKEDAEAHAAKLRAERDAERAELARAIARQDAGISVPANRANKPSMRRLSVPSAADMRAAYAATKRTGDE
jgi:hypothetical protein